MKLNKGKTPAFQAGEILYPNLVNAHFKVRRFMSVICADLKTADVKVAGEDAKLHLFLAKDMATGYLFTPFVGPTLTARDAVRTMEPILREAQASIEHDQVVVLHTDRGSVFRGNEWAQLPKRFPFVQLSMSRYAEPRDNAVIERQFRTMNNTVRIWQKAIGRPKPDAFESWDEAQRAYAAYCEAYNQEFKPSRMHSKLAPEEARALLVQAGSFGMSLDDQGLPLEMAHSSSLVQGNPLTRTVIDTLNDNLYSAWVALTPEERSALLQGTHLKLISDQLAALQQNQAVLGQGLSQVRDDLTATIGAAAKEIIQAVKGKKPKKKVKPRPLRTPMTMAMARVLVTDATVGSASLQLLRDTLATAILAGFGCRLQEVHNLTFEDVETIIRTGRLELFVSKRKRNEIKVMADANVELVKMAFARLTQVLQSANITIKPEAYVFSKLVDGGVKPLNYKHFNASVNKMLAAFSEEYSQIAADKVHVRSHSGRIGLITLLSAKGVDLDVIRQLAGHDDVRSTLRYNRFVLSDHRKRQVLNEVLQEEKQPPLDWDYESEDLQPDSERD